MLGLIVAALLFLVAGFIGGLIVWIVMRARGPRRYGQWVDGEARPPENPPKQKGLFPGALPSPLDPIAGKQRVDLYEGRGRLDIVGESKYQGTLRAIDAGRCEQGQTVVFRALVIPEPENPYDKNAIMVVVEGFGKVGYFCREDAIRYRDMSEELLKRNAIGVCEAELIGGWNDDASIGVKLGVGGPKGVVKALRA